MKEAVFKDLASGPSIASGFIIMTVSWYAIAAQVAKVVTSK